ncbi:hypothetical protein Dxin01_00816 [Deinococcus xinjiangensis]|uniref:Uncharacterized protein n=1 Tax=Deinococcus xinjiangensis TaxID=457454 RepID=A0ABP9V976_9DEIO
MSHPSPRRPKPRRPIWLGTAVSLSVILLIIGTTLWLLLGDAFLP